MREEEHRDPVVEGRRDPASLHETQLQSPQRRCQSLRHVEIRGKVAFLREDEGAVRSETGGAG